MKTTTFVARYLLTLHFDRNYMPNCLDAMIEQIENFLEDCGKLARSSGIKFEAEYHIVSGKSGIHAHVLTNWMPHRRYKHSKTGKRYIRTQRNEIRALMTKNYFLDQNPKESIKRITHHTKRVKSYVRNQNTKGQKRIYSATYLYRDFVPVYTEKKIGSYYSRPFFDVLKKRRKLGCSSKLALISSLIISMIVMISSIFHVFG